MLKDFPELSLNRESVFQEETFSYFISINLMNLHPEEEIHSFMSSQKWKQSHYRPYYTGVVPQL